MTWAGGFMSAPPHRSKVRVSLCVTAVEITSSCSRIPLPVHIQMDPEQLFIESIWSTRVIRSSYGMVL